MVIAIMSLLAALLSPALKAARDTGRQVACLSNLKQIGAAATMYANDNNGWLPHSGAAHVPIRSINRSWKELIAPYLGITTLTRSNLEHGVLKCPSQTIQTCGDSTYGDNGFYGGYGWNYQHVGYGDTDGPSGRAFVNLSEFRDPDSTIMAGDTSDRFVPTYGPFYLYNFSYVPRHKTGLNYLWVGGRATWCATADVEANPAWFYIH